jgi:RNA polymerase sigma-70 factor (ECF subfamily)
MSDNPHLSQIQTLWSVVRLAHGDHTAVQSAQQVLLDRYGGAVRSYALAALRDEDAADEVFQEFALKFVRGDFGTADPGRGRFRAFVKTVVFRLIVDYQRRKKGLLREGPLHSNVAEPAANDAAEKSDEDTFRTSWRDQLLGRCWQRLREIEDQTGKPHYTVLKFRVDHPDARSADLASGLSDALNKPINAGAVRVLLHRARDAFADVVYEEVGHSLDNASIAEVEDELIELNLLEYCKPALDRQRGKSTD